MKDVHTTAKFRRDLKRVKKRRWDIDLLDEVIDLLRAGEELPETYKDHGLKGEWFGSRDCHIEFDWVLIYETGEDEVVLQATGTHADLFE